MNNYEIMFFLENTLTINSLIQYQKILKYNNINVRQYVY